MRSVDCLERVFVLLSFERNMSQLAPLLRKCTFFAIYVEIHSYFLVEGSLSFKER